MLRGLVIRKKREGTLTKYLLGHARSWPPPWRQYCPEQDSSIALCLLALDFVAPTSLAKGGWTPCSRSSLMPYRQVTTFPRCLTPGFLQLPAPSLKPRWPALPWHPASGLIRAGNPLIVVFTQPSINLNSRPDLSVNTQVAAEGTVPACFYLFNGSQCPG